MERARIKEVGDCLTSCIEGSFTVLPPEESVVKRSFADKDMDIELALLCCATVWHPAVTRHVCLTCTDTS